MVENYDNVCSCCGDREIDLEYFICEKCRRRTRDLRSKEAVENKRIVTGQKENEAKEATLDAINDN